MNIRAIFTKKNTNVVQDPHSQVLTDTGQAISFTLYYYYHYYRIFILQNDYLYIF